MALNVLLINLVCVHTQVEIKGQLLQDSAISFQLVETKDPNSGHRTFFRDRASIH